MDLPPAVLPKYLMSEIVWTEETNDRGYEYATGSAFGYRIHLQVGPIGSEFRWRAALLNQSIVGQSPTRNEARAEVLATAAAALLHTALSPDPA